MDIFGSHRTTSTFHSESHILNKGSMISGAAIHPAIHTISPATLCNTFISFLSYVKTHNIPILPVTLPDVRSVLGRGASFIVNGAEVPKTYVDPVSGRLFPQGMIVAFKRSLVNYDMEDPVADRIRVMFNELITMQHPPLSAHPNIVNLLGVGFEIEGVDGAQNAMPVLILECAELGNLADILRTARQGNRLLKFEEKISLCLDVAHGLEALHACGEWMLCYRLDLVHGDVKCENVLVFERAAYHNVNNSQAPVPELHCKIIDFGVSRYPNGKVILGGSRPWQAPECLRGKWMRLREAKRTDVYSFGMLVWRVFLDGDPFRSLAQIDAKNPKEKFHRRNNAVANLKDNDELVRHVCDSLAQSKTYSPSQLEVLYEVTRVTLVKDAFRREDMTRLIIILTSDTFYEPRFPMPPIPITTDIDADLLDIDRWYLEFESTSPVVQSQIVSGFRDYCEGLSDSKSTKRMEDGPAAAYQLAICYANGFGVPFQPDDCLKWLVFAAERGSQKASEALPNVTRALKAPWRRLDDSGNGDDSASTGGYPRPLHSLREDTNLTHVVGDCNNTTEDQDTNMESANCGWTILSASQSCRYDVLNALLEDSSEPNVSQDHVSSLHFLSYWSIEQAENLACRLIQAGVDINTKAKRGVTVGGTPLMWSVYGGDLEHSSILLRFGADPMASTYEGDDALSFAARSHQARHLRLLLKNIRPAQLCGHISRLLEAAAGGESRFSRMKRHGINWESAAGETLQLLKDWDLLFADCSDFKVLLTRALVGSLRSPHGRMNTDVQMCFIEQSGIEPSDLCELLSESVLTFNVRLFSSLLEYGVPVTTLYNRKKSLVHLCAKIPDHSLAATAFAPRLLDFGATIDAQDEDGITPWMEATLERKWDLADLLLRKGANTLINSRNGLNILGLCIKALNVGSIKYLLKYSADSSKFHQQSFLVNQDLQISALQLATTLPLPRSQGMKLETTAVFMVMLDHLGSQPWQLCFRSNGILPDATALDIAASLGNVHAVKNLVMRGAHSMTENRKSALTWINAKRPDRMTHLQIMDLERSAYIIENWDDLGEQVRTLADSWTKVQRDEDSHIAMSWEAAPLDYKTRKGLTDEVRGIRVEGGCRN